MNPEMVNVLIWQGGSHIGIGGSIFRNGWLSKCGLMALTHQNIHLGHRIYLNCRPDGTQYAIFAQALQSVRDDETIYLCDILLRMLC